MACASTQTVPTPSLRARFGWGAVWSVSGAFAAHGGNLLVSLLTARLIGRAGYGQYGFVISTVMMFAIFASLSLGVTSTRFVAELRLSDPERTARVIALCSRVSLISGGVLAAIVWLAAPALPGITTPELIWAVRIAGSSLLFIAVNSAQLGTLSGFAAWKEVAAANAIKSVTALTITAALVPLWGVLGAVSAFAAAMAAACVYTRFAVRRQALASGVPLRAASIRPELPIIWRFSLPALVGAAASMPATWLATTFLAARPYGYPEVGTLTLAMQWRIAILMTPTALAGLLIPMLAEVRRSGAGELRFLRLNVGLNAAITAAAAAGVIVCSPVILRFYGPEFQAGALPLTILAASTITAATATVLEQFAVSRGRVWISTVSILCWGACLCAFAWHWVDWGAAGIAASHLIASVLQLSMLAALLWPSLKPTRS